MEYEPVEGDEPTLVALAVSGDLDAFRALYERNVRVVHGFLRARVGNTAADDLTAETFCRAFERIGRYEWRGVPFRAWLIRIALNLVVARSRRKSTDELPMDDPSPPPAEGPEDSVVQGLESAALLQSLRRLPAAQRTVLELRFIRDLSVTETAAVLSMTEEAVRAATYRALKALRAIHGESGRSRMGA